MLRHCENFGRFSEKGKKSSLYAAILDISKAFDCVPHKEILNALKEQGIHNRLVEYLRKAYSGVSTYMKNCEGLTLEVERGVKQGDPLSALLFNLVINPIIDGVYEMAGGFHVDGKSCFVLAFADDLVLLFKREKELQASLNYVSEYLHRIGLALPTGKCTVFEVKKSGKSWKMVDVNASVSGQRKK